MSPTGFPFPQIPAVIAALLLAPLLLGWVRLLNAGPGSRTAAVPGLLQPYRLLHKLFNKDSVMARTASPLSEWRLAWFRLHDARLRHHPHPVDLPLSIVADAIALVGLFAVARVFISLAAMDAGTAFGSLGARREMLIGFLARPALLTVFFTASLISQSPALTSIVENIAHRIRHLPEALPSPGWPSHPLFRRECPVPVDNPATHLELTMIPRSPDPRILGRHLAWWSGLRP